MNTLPPSIEVLREILDSSWRWIEPSEREAVKQSFTEATERFPWGESAQIRTREAIARCVPLFHGPIRAVRRTGEQRSATLLYDPLLPDVVRLALGADQYPDLWPHAEPSAEGIAEGFAPYLAREPRSAHHLSRSLRVAHGTLEEIGLESIDMLARVLAASCSWLDAGAPWSNGALDDPWPEDIQRASLVTLQVAQKEATATLPGRWPSVSMRTLWSRSVLTIQQAPFGAVVLELRWDPAPAVRSSTLPESSVPSDIPADLLGIFLRGESRLVVHVDEMLSEGPTPYAVWLACQLEPGEPRTNERLRALLRDPASRSEALALCDAFGAWSLPIELAAETGDVELREQLTARCAPRPPSDEEEER